MINKEEFEKASFEENQKFIKEVLRLATHNSFTKDDLLFLIKWQNETIEKMKCCANCDYWFDMDSTCELHKETIADFMIDCDCKDWKCAYKEVEE